MQTQNEHPTQPLWSENTSTKEETESRRYAESRSINGNYKEEKWVRGVISGRGGSGCKCLKTGEKELGVCEPFRVAGARERWPEIEVSSQQESRLRVH